MNPGARIILLCTLAGAATAVAWRSTQKREDERGDYLRHALLGGLVGLFAGSLLAGMI